MDIRPAVQQLIAGLKKVYADKNLQFHVRLAGDCLFPGDRGDFLELLGNLLDNSCKWAGREVGLSARICAGAPRLLEIVVWDDGPGVREEEQEVILERGIHRDPSARGEGIGLAVVRDIVQTYQGQLRIDRGANGGGYFQIRIPLSG